LRAKSTESAIAWHKMLYKASNRLTYQELFAWNFANQVRFSIFFIAMIVTNVVPLFFKPLNSSLSPTYPEYMVIPKQITQKDLVDGKDFRFLQRWPAVVWKCRETRAVLLRSSQPRLSIFGWRNNADEKFFELVLVLGKDMLIMDARSYAAAWANRAKGGGFEHPEYYQRTRVDWLALPNIHNVRYSFHQLRALLCSNQNRTGESYLSALESTGWLNYIKDLMNAARKCVDTLFDGQSVLVHCSDGWDRTTQIVSLAKLMGDEYYRTIQGFEGLIRLEWVAFGHKFADRNGIAGTNNNEQSPIFLQFLDAVHQMQHQLPTAFEFNRQYLVRCFVLCNDRLCFLLFVRAVRKFYEDLFF
uniref:Phosphatidylinositol-3-phosphatase n=1 Tax=Angiostrongylus cantonensis TaxID=6313 RepID=A0A0K0DJ93_ANGCA